MRVLLGLFFLFALGKYEFDQYVDNEISSSTAEYNFSHVNRGVCELKSILSGVECRDMTAQELAYDADVKAKQKAEQENAEALERWNDAVAAAKARKKVEEEAALISAYGGGHGGSSNGLSSNLSPDTCKFHAALAKEFMSMRLDGKTKAEALADVRKRRAGWDSVGLPKEYGEVNEKLVNAIYATGLLEDMSQKDELLNLISKDVFKLCFEGKLTNNHGI